MERLMELIERKFLKDVELLELEDIENVIECKMTQPYNACLLYTSDAADE